MRQAIVSMAVFGLLCWLAIGHPHIQKTVTAKVGDNEIKLAYYTTPANMEHARSAAVGSFSVGAQLTLPVAMKGESGEIPAGEYTVGALKVSDNSWTLGLHPGKLSYGQEPDVSSVIKLESMFTDQHGVAEHSHFDISPGSGPLAGKTAVSWHFGSLFLAGALD